MELWDEVLEEKPIFGDEKFRGVTVHPPKQIDVPAANNIVGDLDNLDRLAYQCADEGEVHGYESK